MTTPVTRTHVLIPMTGRDPHESHRAATPLELLYDLTYVVAFSIAGGQPAPQGVPPRVPEATP